MDQVVRYNIEINVWTFKVVYKFKILNFKICELKADIWDFKWLQIKNFGMDHINIWGCFKILNFKIHELKLYWDSK
jgi:hypothetical protein